MNEQPIPFEKILEKYGKVCLEREFLIDENDRLKRVIAEYKESKGENNGAK